MDGIIFIYGVLFFEIKLANAVKIMKFILQILVDFVIINLKTIFI